MQVTGEKTNFPEDGAGQAEADPAMLSAMLSGAGREGSQRGKQCQGRLAQEDRALVSGTKGRAFESRIAHHHQIRQLVMLD